MIGKKVEHEKLREILEEEGIRTRGEHEFIGELRAMEKDTCLMYPPARGFIEHLGLTSLITSVGKGYRVFSRPDGLYVYREP